MNRKLLFAAVFSISLLFSSPNTDYPSVAIGVVDQGKVDFFFHGREINKYKIFEIGSITKIFTTLLLMDMVKRGEVGLDDPIGTYLAKAKVPEYEDKKDYSSSFGYTYFRAPPNAR